MDKHPGPKLPKPRAGVDGAGSTAGKRVKDNPARPYNRPPDAKLIDVRGLLIVFGLAIAGFLLAVLFIKVGG